MCGRPLTRPATPSPKLKDEQVAPAEAVPLGSDLDPEIDRNLALDEEDRAWEVEQFASLFGHPLRPLEPGFVGSRPAGVAEQPSEVRGDVPGIDEGGVLLAEGRRG